MNKPSSIERPDYLPKNSKLLMIRIPQGDQVNLKREAAFEQFLVNLHETLQGGKISMEMTSLHQHIYFHIWVSEDLKELVESQVYASYPDAEIETNMDYSLNKEVQNLHLYGVEMALKRSDIYPIKTYEQFEGDSLASIFTVLSQAQENEQIWIQVVLRPLDDDWKLNLVRNVKMKLIKIRNIFRIRDYFKMKKRSVIKAQDYQAFNVKAEKHAFRISLRMAYLASEKGVAIRKLNALAKAFTQFDTIEMNEFKFSRPIPRNLFIKRYGQRIFKTSFVISSQELASLYHFPNADVVPHIVHVMAKRAEPPLDLPKSSNFLNSTISTFGTTNYHNQRIQFGIKREDRRRHLYVVGKSGTGKSKMLELLIMSDILNGEGIGVLDPHGDLVDNVLRHIPKERINDVVLFNPADLEFPVAFNPLEQVEPEFRVRVTIGFIEIFKKLFGNNWTPRVEHVLRYTTLALLDSPNTTVLSILKMLSDKNYRQKIVAHIEDSVVKNFWVNEFAAWSEKFDNEAIMPLLNKVGQFVSTSLIRNIVGQPDNKIDIADIMNNRKILLMRISKGTLGEENAALIGAMVVTKIQQAAMARASLPEDQRKDFYLYCDEFQYFATDTFAEILSEARKYRLNLTMAHQYMGQLSEQIRKTAFGNVGSMINFRIGAEDAIIMEKEYEPIFKVRDIINLGVREFYIKMSVDGEIRDAFSGRTINVPKVQEDFTKEIIQQSRTKYSRPVKEVENILKAWNEDDEVPQNVAEMAGEQSFEEPIV